MTEHGAGGGDRWQHLAPIHSWKTTATITIVLVPLIAVGALMYRGRDSATVPHLTPPEGASAATLPPPTTLPASLAGLPLPGVDGTTTPSTVRLRGSAKLGGVVSGPAGPIQGAIVHVERVDGGYANDTTTGTDARYLFVDMPGGRYRVRAFLPPTYAQTQSVVAFIAADEEHVEDLQVEQFDPLAVTAAVAPDPPTVGTPFNLVVRVAKRAVDSEGVVRSTATAGASIVVSSTGSLFVTTSTATTGPDGTVTILSACKAAGPLGASVQVKLTAADPGQTVNLDLPACAAAPPPTTTTPVTTPTTATTTPTTAKPN